MITLRRAVRTALLALVLAVVTCAAVPLAPAIARAARGGPAARGPAPAAGSAAPAAGLAAPVLGAQDPLQAPPSLGPIRLVPTGPGARVTVHAVFPPNPNACPANQPQDLTAAYPGTLEVGRQSNGSLYLITELTFADYLKGIAEVPTSWPLAALEAQVVAARTYALSHMNSGTLSGLNYNLCSTDACQVYRGLGVQDGPYGQQWTKAVDDTAGQILQYQGRPADAFYFSTSDGHTRASSDVFGGPSVPYLQPVVENDDSQSPESSWSVSMPLTDLAQTLALAGSWDGGPIDTVLQQGGDVVVSGSGNSVSLPLSTFRNKLNVNAVCLQPRRYPTPESGGGSLPQVVPSVWLRLAQQGSTMVLTGRGWGHGVGMVQWGAKGKADRGLGYSDILAAYYGGLRPVKVSEPGSIRVLVASGVQQVTLAPSGPLRVDGAPAGSGPLTVTGGAAMTVTAGGPIASTLSLSVVSATASAMPSAPAQFSFTLNHAANVALTYQQSAGGSVSGTLSPAPFPSGSQTLPWDPLAAGLPPGSYAVALLADDGVSRVVSPSFTVTVGSTASPSPSPQRLRAAPPQQAGSSSSSSLPSWLPFAAGAALLLIVAGASGTFLLVSRRPAAPGAAALVPRSAWQPGQGSSLAQPARPPWQPGQSSASTPAKGSAGKRRQKSSWQPGQSASWQPGQGSSAAPRPPWQPGQTSSKPGKSPPWKPS